MSVKNENSEVEVYFHAEGRTAEIVPARASDTVADVLVRAGIAGEHGIHVFVGESTACLTLADDERDDLEDPQEEAPLGRTLEDLGAGRGIHIRCHRCQRVAVQVNYKSKTKKHRFSPSTTIATVIAWARRKFHLTDPDNAKLRLQICGSTNRPPLETHLGELVPAGTCALCFDLVFEEKVEGEV